MLLLSFRRFGLATQNPSWMHNFISIPSILFDFETNGRFCLLFVVSSWPPRTPPEWIILPEFLQFYTILKPMDACAYCSRFQPGRPEPPRTHDFTDIPSILNNFEANECVWVLFAISAWPPRTPPECIILPAFLQFYMILKPMDSFPTFRGFSLATQNPPRAHDFISIPSILCDFEANGWFCLLSAVSAQLPRAPSRRYHFTGIPSILHDFEANGCFSQFQPSRPEPP